MDCDQQAYLYHHHQGYEWENQLTVVPLCWRCHTFRHRRRPWRPRACEICGKEFEKASLHQVTCSDDCLAELKARKAERMEHANRWCAEVTRGVLLTREETKEFFGLLEGVGYTSPVVKKMAERLGIDLDMLTRTYPATIDTPPVDPAAREGQ